MPSAETTKLQSAEKQAAVVVPYEIAMGKQIVQLRINDKGPYPFIFDTGAGEVVISKRIKDELKLISTGTELASSPAGGTPVEVETFTLESVELAGIVIENIDASSIDFGPMDLYGVIGPAVFEAYGRVAIDFSKQSIEIGGELHNWPDKTWLPFGESAPLLDVNLKIGDAVIASHIDTGAPQTIAVPATYQDQLALTGPVTVVGRGRTIDHEFEIREAPIDTVVTIGDATIPLDRVTIFDIPIGNVGLGALNGLYLEIDWDGHRFALHGEAVPVVQRSGARRMMVRGGGTADQDKPFGLMNPSMTDSGLRVGEVVSGSRAETAGLKTGDLISSINSTPLSEIGFENLRAVFGGEISELSVMRDGANIRLVPAEG